MKNYNWKYKIQRRFVWTGVIAGVVGCVSGSIRPLNVAQGLPVDMPSDLKARFEVKETGASSDSHGDRQLASSGQGRRSKPFAYPDRKPAKDAIWVGEKLMFDISYFGITAGEMSLEVLPPKIMGTRTVLPIQGHGVSSTLFSLVYRLDDTVESYFDYLGSFSHRLHVVLDETKQKRDALELFDSEKKQTYYWNRWERPGIPYSETKIAAEIQPFSQDSMTSLYYLRSVPLTIGQVISFPVVSEGKSFEAVCTVLRREMIGSPMGQVSAWVIRPQMKIGGEIKNKEDSFLWLTDDERRIPIRLEAKVKVGTVVANLRRIELGIPPKQDIQRASESSFGRQLAVQSD